MLPWGRAFKKLVWVVGVQALFRSKEAKATLVQAPLGGCVVHQVKERASSLSFGWMEIMKGVCVWVCVCVQN